MEELHFRGYTQPRLVTALHNLPAGTALTAAGFGLQHVVFAVTISSALAYAVGFFLWITGGNHRVNEENFRETTDGNLP